MWSVEYSSFRKVFINFRCHGQKFIKGTAVNQTIKSGWVQKRKVVKSIQALLVKNIAKKEREKRWPEWLHLENIFTTWSCWSNSNGVEDTVKTDQYNKSYQLFLWCQINRIKQVMVIVKQMERDCQNPWEQVKRA